MITNMITKFYCFRQNNSGGVFINDDDKGICEYVIIEAESGDDANERAEKIGLYFDGASYGRDCSCCGDRWYRAYGKEGADTPMLYNDSIYDVIAGEYRKGAYIHYIEKQMEYVPFKLSEEDKIAEEKRIADLQKADNWEVATYGVEGSNKWGRIAINTKTGAKTTLGGCNFSLMFPEPITEKRTATKEEVEKITAMFNLRDKLK